MNKNTIENEGFKIVKGLSDGNMTCVGTAKACDEALKESQNKALAMENKLRSDELKSSKEVT